LIGLKHRGGGGNGSAAALSFLVVRRAGSCAPQDNIRHSSVMQPTEPERIDRIALGYEQAMSEDGKDMVIKGRGGAAADFAGTRRGSRCGIRPQPGRS
jgi:hypothetical protein